MLGRRGRDKLAHKTGGLPLASCCRGRRRLPKRSLVELMEARSRAFFWTSPGSPSIESNFVRPVVRWMDANFKLPMDQALHRLYLQGSVRVQTVVNGSKLTSARMLNRRAI